MTSLQGEGQDMVPAVRKKKKKAATKRKVLKVQGNTPMINVYGVSDISKSFKTSALGLLAGDSDEEENYDQFSIKLLERNKKSKVPKLNSKDKSETIDVEEIGSSPVGTPESSPLNTRKISSPSPPPPPPLQIDQSNDRRLTKTVRNLNKAYSIAVNAQNWQSALTPSPATLNHCRTPDVDMDSSFDTHREQITVKVRTRHGLRRFEINMDEPLIKIIISLAEEEDVDVNTLSLTRSAEQLNEDDTPASLKLKVTDILDCVIINPSDAHTEDLSALIPDEDKVELKFQGQEKKSVFSITVTKDEKLKRALEAYSDFLKQPLDSLKFSFDGEDVGPMDTPEKLDMDEQGTIDVTSC